MEEASLFSWVLVAFANPYDVGGVQNTKKDRKDKKDDKGDKKDKKSRGIRF